VCSRYPALPYRKILLIQQAQDQIGTGLLVNYRMGLVLTNFYRELFVIAPVVEPHSNQSFPFGYLLLLVQDDEQ